MLRTLTLYLRRREIARTERLRRQQIAYAKRAAKGHRVNALAEARRLTHEALKLEVRS